MSDEVREQIEGIMRQAAMSEPEARASYHLGEAHEALREAVFATEASEAPEFDGAIVQMYLTTTLAPHFDALHNVLAVRTRARAPRVVEQAGHRERRGGLGVT